MAMSTEQVWRMIDKLTAPLKRRVGMMLLRAIVETIDDSQELQSVKIESFEDSVREDVEHFQPGGITHRAITTDAENPAEGIALAIGGSSDHPIAMLVSNRASRPTGLSPGETKVYSAVGDHHVHLKEDGSVETKNDDGVAVATVHGDGHASQIGTTVELGDDPATGPVALASLTDGRAATIEAKLTELLLAFNVHTHTDPTLFQTSPTGTPVTVQLPNEPPVAPLVPGGSTAASKVNAT